MFVKWGVETNKTITDMQNFLLETLKPKLKFAFSQKTKLKLKLKFG